jgi:hypothetical protein
MKYLKRYKIFESWISIDKWEDLKDLIQMEIMDKWGISNSLVDEVKSAENKTQLLEPALRIRINERFDNNEPVEIIKDVRNLYKRVFSLTGKFLKVEWSSQAIFVYLSKLPNHYTIIQEFGLTLDPNSDNTFDRKVGAICTYEQALEIFKYLNGFYRFAYDSDIKYFTEAYQILSDLYKVEIVFSLPRFEDERFRQVVCFEFKLKSGKERVIGRHFPVFIINTNHTDSPCIMKRTGSYNFIQIPCTKQKSFLKDEQF